MRALDVEACRDLVVSERWLSKIQEADNGCLLWIACVNKAGYGSVRLKSRQPMVHRVALVASLGRDLAEGMEAGHLCHDFAVAAGSCSGGVCDHRRCVNPDHLAEQSRRENILRGDTLAAGQVSRTHCQQGHELAGDNLVPSELPKRKCLACSREWARQRDGVIRVAYKSLGITREEYFRIYGGSLAVAEAQANSR